MSESQIHDVLVKYSNAGKTDKASYHSYEFFYPQELIEQYSWPDISGHGGWAAYKRSLAAVG
jgi:hypothetical protein